ncbi:uncharacterized protein [Temnothorax longispinosus]|uniref:uncharacterized protein isoform X5 n=1 Tax=Temnothorax longispinosus TaxID=300112 RepID=UPI003A9958F9
MNLDVERYYAVNKLFLLQIGGWPYQRKIIKILIPCLMTIVLYSAIVTQFRRLLQLMNKHWELFNSEFERHILRYNAGIGQKVANYFAVYLNATLIFHLLTPFMPKILDIVIPLNESRPLAYVYRAEHRVDKEKYYYPIVFHSYMTCIIVVVIIFTVDTTYLKCVLHACSLFTAISQRLENITGEADTILDDYEKIHSGTHYHLEMFMEKNSSAGNDYSELMTCLKKHQLALEHAQTLDSMFTQATLILLSLNMVVLSVIGIQFVNNLTQGEIIKYVFVTYGVFIHLIYMCIPGQLLIDRSREVFDKAYSSAWYTFSIKSRKLLRVLLYRSLAPCTLTAGKMFVMSMTTCSSVLLLYDTWGDIDIVVECTITLTPLFAASTKLINIVVNNDKFQRLLQLMNEHWEFFNSEYERHILRHYASIGQKVTSYYAVYFTITLISYLLIPLIPRILDIVIPLNESRPLAYIYQAEYRVDEEKYYYLIIFHTYIVSTITTTILFTVDTTYIVCTLHACSLFTAISWRLENIIGEADTKSDNNEKIYTGMHYHLEIFAEKHGSANNDYRELIMCLKKHQLALEHVKTLDSIFTHATFILLSLNVLILSVIGIQLINNLTHTEEVIRYGFITFAAFIHLVCMCIPGQLLIDRSTDVFDKAYGSSWYTFSVKSKKLLRVLLYRSLAPCTLTAGKMFVMSMTMCSSVMQTAMSYFTAFLSVKK